MYKVVIIDDEPIIVEGISRIIPWKKYQCEIVATANDGIEGQAIIREYKPDIVFSDISMPGMDGLTMVAGLKSEFENIQISILTGYRDFDYAQKAIRLGVARFLLKPSNIEEIEEAVEAMTENLKRNQLLTDEGSNSLHKDSVDEVVEKQPKEKKSETVASSFVVNNAMKYIESNYTRKLSLADVAEKAYVSQWHLSKLLNKHMGQNFSEILNNIRLREAKELLKDPSLRIGDIATSVGFVDIAHFSRVFKKNMGIAANEYRNSLDL